MFTQRFLDWFRLGDYDRAIHRERVAVIKRFARGNVSFQNGNLLDDAAFEELRDKGDRAIAELIAQQNACLENAGHHRPQRPASANPS